MYRLIIFFIIGSTAADRTDPLANPSQIPAQGKTAAMGVIPILNKTHEMNPDGSFQWSYESGNGISAQEKGQPLDIPGRPIGVAGGYSYKSSDGSEISLTYVADENGFRPVGDHLPVAPPIPVLIARALEWIAKKSLEVKR